MALSEADIQQELDRRKPGTSRHVTQRQESDRIEILSGVFEGSTTGTAIGFLIRNEDQRSKDYGKLADTFRPGHADYTYWQKYGIRDYRGGGRASARETMMRVAAGAIAKKWLRERYGVQVRGYLSQLGPNQIAFKSWDAVDQNPFFVAGSGHRARARSLHGRAARVGRFLRREGERGRRAACRSAGASRCTTGSTPTSPSAMMGINAVKGVEIGAGFASIEQKGSEHGDELTPEGFLSNNAGGMLGGISTGQDVLVNIALKPTSSIRLPRRSIDRKGDAETVQTTGRHDPCVGIRATPIAEAMLACVLMDHALRHRAQCADVSAAAAADPRDARK